MTDTFLLSKTVEQKQQETLRKCELLSQRKEPEVTTTTTSYTVDYGPKVVDGSVTPVDSKAFVDPLYGNDSDKHLLSRKKTEHTTQHITTTTKVIRQFHRIGPNGEILNEQVIQYPEETNHRHIEHPLQPGYEMDTYRPHSPTSESGSRGQYEGYTQGGYDYDPYSRRPHDEFYGYTSGTQPQPPAANAAPYDSRYTGTAGRDYPVSGYAELDGGLLPPNGQEHYRNSPSPALHGVPNDRYDAAYDRPEAPNVYQPQEHHASPEGFPMADERLAAPVEDYYSLKPRTLPRYGSEQSEHYLPNDTEVYGQFRPPSSQYMTNGDNHQPSHEESPSIPRHMAPLAQGSPQVSANTPLLPHPSPGPATPSMPSGAHEIYGTSSRMRPPSTDSSSRVRWRDPDLHEVIDFLSNPNNVVKANAAAYLQHLCYMDDATKQKTRMLGGIPPLVALLTHDLPELYRNACGALRNLSYGRQNDENKRTIKEAGGIPSLVRLLHKSPDNEVKELVTGILWNLSSCEELKQNILDDALTVIVNRIIIPCSGWGGSEVDRDPNNDVWWSTVFKNASGVIRNISSAGEYARTKLRQCPGLVDSLFCVIKLAIQGNSHDNKSVENCVCILRNLSYRCQEVEDPNYDKSQLPTQSRASGTDKGDNLGCFGGSRKKREMVGHQLKESATGSRSTGHRNQPVRGMELLWQPDLVVQPYLALLSDCSNPETLEAAAGALQNLAACYWQPSIDVRACVRKEKGLPILVELLRMEVDRVVCAVATALRNLAIDQRNKELIGKYAMRDLVQKLPSSSSHDGSTSDETIAAVLATLNEVIKKNAEFSRTLLEAGGVERLVYISKQRVRYSSRVVKFASQVLYSLWGHQELREVYKKSGWKEPDFVSKSVASRNTAAGGAHSPTANNTLNRPMASQGGTRYEDRTIQRSNNHQKQHAQYVRREEVPLADLAYGGDHAAQGGNVRLYPSSMQAKPGEPVYAKVNRDRKRTQQYDGGIYGTGGEEWVESPPTYSSAVGLVPDYVEANISQSYSDANPLNSSVAADAANNNDLLHVATDAPAGDSWV